MNDEYINRFLAAIHLALGGEQEDLILIINKIYQDGFEDGVNTNDKEAS